MIKLKFLIKELFDNYYPFGLYISRAYSKTYTFTSSTAGRYFVYFNYFKEYTPELVDLWEVSFEQEDEGYKLTGTGDEFKVMSTIIKIIQKFVKEEDPTHIMFSASKIEVHRGKYTNRVRIYKAMVDKFAKAEGYTYTIDNKEQEVIFYLNKISQ